MRTGVLTNLHFAHGTLTEKALDPNKPDANIDLSVSNFLCSSIGIKSFMINALLE